MNTKATSGKLARSLDQLEDFLSSDNVDKVVDAYQLSRLIKAREIIADIESDVFGRENP